MGETPSGQLYIETIPKRGYRFAADVREERRTPGELLIKQSSETRVIVEEEDDSSDASGVKMDSAREWNRSAGAESGIASHTVSVTSRSVNRLWQRYGSLSSSHRVLAAVILAIVVCGLAAFAHYRIGLGRSATLQAGLPLQNLRFAKLTTSGRTRLPSISPDGKYLAYVEGDAGAQSVWIQQVATQSRVQIVPPADAEYQEITFSRDGNYIFYVMYCRPKFKGELYLIPALGGIPARSQTTSIARLHFRLTGDNWRSYGMSRRNR